MELFDLTNHLIHFLVKSNQTIFFGSDFFILKMHNKSIINNNFKIFFQKKDSYSAYYLEQYDEGWVSGQGSNSFGKKKKFY